MASPTLVRIDDVSKRFVIRKEKSLKERVVNAGRSRMHKEDFWALRDVSLEIESGSTVGLIGANGSGKSTLLKLIGGILQPTTGSVSRRGRLAALIELGAGFHPDLTGRENVYLNCAILGLSRESTAKHFDSIVDFSGIERFIDTQVKFYSSGMYIRLAFAVAVHVDPDLLLVDEVLAVGDEPFQRKCMDRIHAFQSEGRTIVLVTHALEQVAELCDRAVVLDSGRVGIDGKPIDALRYLRADFDQTLQTERERERERSGAATKEPTASRARIVDVSVFGSSGEPLTSMSPGGDLVVRIEVEAIQQLEDWILGISVDTSLGQMVFGTNTKLMDVRLPPISGARTFTVRIPHLQLAEGNYLVGAAVAEASGVEIDRQRGGASFQVQADGTSVGHVFARAEFSAT